MDRGRQIDNIQNSNAVYLDRFGKSGKTSTKIINPPGGQDHFSLGWEDPKEIKPNTQTQNPPSMNKPRIERKKENQPRTIPNKYQPKTQQVQNNNNNININQQHTSVRVNQRPGGNSNIVFGNDDSNYDHYRK